MVILKLFEVIILSGLTVFAGFLIIITLANIIFKITNYIEK